jgi:hypothetical protein
MDLNGKIKLIYDTQEFASGFKKREFVVTTQEQYPQDVKFEAIKEKVDLLDTYKPGDEVNVHFNIRGNEYQGKYYVNLQAWRLERGQGAAPQPQAEPSQPAAASATPPPPPPPSADDEDDLPF